MKKLNLLFLLGIFLVSGNLCAQSPWVNPTGSYYTSLSTYVVTPSHVLTNGANSSRFINRDVFEVTASIYGEYSVNNKFGVYANLPGRYVSSVSGLADTTGAIFDAVAAPDTVLSAGNLIGLGNIELGAKYSLIDKRLKLAAFADVSLPTGSRDDATALLTAIPATEVRVGLTAGGSGNKWYSYGNLAFGYRTNNYSSRVHGLVEFGRRFGSFFTLGVFTNAKLSVFNTDDDIPFSDDDQIHTGFYLNNQDYIAFGVKANFDITEQWGAGLSLGGAFFARHLQQAPAIGLNVWYNMRKE